MITIRAGKAAIGVCLLVLAGCSREQQDWRSAEAADSIEAYDQFIQRHPESELAAQARTRVAQLGEDRDWQHAGSADTPDAYRQFITQHPNGKWAQEARIRIENFSLSEQRESGSVGGTNAASGAGAMASMRPDASGAAAGSGGSTSSGGPRADGGTWGRGLAVPGEAAVPAGRVPSGASTGRPAGATAVTAAATSAPAATGSAAGGASFAATAATAAGPAMAGHASASAGPSVGSSTAPTRSVSYGVQLGAFSSESAANTEWHLLVGRFGSELQGLSPHVVMAETASGRIYRLQAVVGPESQARAICDSLRKSSQACVAVLPH